MRCLVFLAAMFLCSPVRAELWGISVMPPDPVMGDEVEYTPIDSGDKPIMSYKWEYAWNGGPCAPNWIVAPSTNYHYYAFERIPGEWLVRCTVTYFPELGQPPETDSYTEHVTVGPATRAAIVYGPGIKLDINGITQGRYIPVIFRIYGENWQGQERQCGPWIQSLTSQESILNYMYYEPPFPPNHPGIPLNTWYPDPPNSFPAVDVWWNEQNYVWDAKRMGLAPQLWNPLNVGDGILRYTMRLRLKYPDPCRGPDRTINLGDFRLENYKESATDWSIRFW